MALTEVADLGNPVVHLGVDVDGPLAVPRRREAVIPDPLQRCRQASRAAACNQEVTRVLEIQGEEARIAATRPHGSESGISRLLSRTAGVCRHASQFERDASEPRPVFGDVRLTKDIHCFRRTIE